MTWTAEQRRAVTADRMACGLCIVCARKVAPGEGRHCPDCHRVKLRAARRWKRSAHGRELERISASIRRTARIAAGLCSSSGCSTPAAPNRKQCRRCLDAVKLRVQLRMARAEGVIS